MYGQERIINSLKEELNSSNFAILVGQRGQGRRTISKHIANIRGMNYQEVNDLKMDNIRSIIDEAYKKPNPVLYNIVTNDKVPVQIQNAILRFTENPPENSLIFLSVTVLHNVLPTIKSRGVIYNLEQYSKEDLRQFTNNEYILEVCNNPGEIKRLEELDINSIKAYIQKVYNNIGRISKVNVFNMWKHFEDVFKDKDNLDLFIKVLLNEYSKDKKNRIEEIKTLYQYHSIANIKGLNKKVLFEGMFTKLRDKAWNLTQN